MFRYDLQVQKPSPALHPRNILHSVFLSDFAALVIML